MSTFLLEDLKEDRKLSLEIPFGLALKALHDSGQATE